MTQQTPPFIAPIVHPGSGSSTDSIAERLNRARERNTRPISPKRLTPTEEHSGPVFDPPDDIAVTEILFDDEPESDEMIEDTPAAGAFAGSSPDYRRTHADVPISRFQIDSRIQRPLQKRHVAKMARTLNTHALGMVVASVRVDPETGVEEWYLLDGQQRVNAVHMAKKVNPKALVGWDGLVHCEFHHNLTLAEEAQLFRELNNRRNVAMTVQFNASLYEGDLSEEGRNSNAIEAILESLGIERTSKGFNAVTLAMRLAQHNNGLVAFRWALEVIQETWKREPGADKDYKPVIVEALALLYLQHGTLIDRQRMVRMLKEGTKDESTLIGSARSRQTVHKGTIMPNMINVIAGFYNKQLRDSGGRKLPEWDVKRRTIAFD